MPSANNPFEQPSDPRLEKRAITHTRIEMMLGTYVISRLASSTPESDIYRFEFTAPGGVTEYPGQWSSDPDAVLEAAKTDLIGRLREKALSGPEIAPGITVSEMYSPCPVQAQGGIDGVIFDFKARGGRWALSLRRTTPALPNGWHFEEAYGDDAYSAGWMTEDEARAFIVKAAGLWRSGHPGVAEGSARPRLTVPLMD